MLLRCRIGEHVNLLVIETQGPAGRRTLRRPGLGVGEKDFRLTGFHQNRAGGRVLDVAEALRGEHHARILAPLGPEVLFHRLGEA